MRRDYPYLRNSDFLMDFSREKNKEQRVKITVLNFNEKPVKEIQGRVISGNINIDGRSSIRRTANLTVFIEEKDASYMEIVNGIFSLNKKIKLEMGLTNNSGLYEEFPILWFPLGTYAIMGLSTSHSTSGTTATLQLKDKMVFLNGECGGTISAAVDFHEYEELDSSTGEYYIKKPTIVQIIRELVNHFGGEALERIIISDIDTRIKKVMKWTGDKPLYRIGNVYTTEEPGNNEEYEKIKTGEDAAFVYSDFYFPGDLIGDAGNSVVTILDKIKNTLGNYEYFYDLDGNFIFQEIKNYLNTSKSTIDLKKQNDKDSFEIGSNSNHYFLNRKGSAEYVFDNSEIITSYSNSPQYLNVKNDFVVWGARKTVDGKTLPIRYHLAIDRKPKVGNIYECYYIEDGNVKRPKFPLVFTDSENFPEIGEVEKIYLMKKKNYFPHYAAFTWNPEVEYYIPVENDIENGFYNSLSFVKNEKGDLIIKEIEKEVPSELIVNDITDGSNNSPPIEITLDKEMSFKDLIEEVNKVEEKVSLVEKCLRETGQIPPFEIKKVKCYVSHYHPILDENGYFQQPSSFESSDWRTELYLSGALADSRFGVDSNYYYTELVNEWPKLYDMENKTFYEEVLEYPYELDYYLDFIDSVSTGLSNISIENIGRRTKVINSNDINCIFEREVPDYVVIEKGQNDTIQRISECFSKGQNYSLTSSEIFSKMAPGGTQNSAYNEIRNLLYQYISFNETISVQMIPLYFLDPNIRITVKDSQSGINGDYMINSISLPLDINGTMSLSCSKALERI